MTEKVLKCGIKREPGWIYFIDKEGDVSKAKATNHDKVVAKATEASSTEAK